MKKYSLLILTACSLFFSFNIGLAQTAPNLGTASRFVLFSSTGAVGNTGISQLTGDVGANNGAITGFGNVNGVMHNNDGASSQGAADLLIAYNQLNSTIPGFFPAPLLGNGDTLRKGVYQISGAATLNSNLYLNAQGDPNAVFIFQVQGSLSTATSSKVKLINGAQACNVFWKVEGLVSMASNTYMTGTIVANNAAISMSANDTLEGRALSTAGAVTLNGVMAYIPTGCGKSVLTGPNRPDLASTACYAIFSSNGSVINAGISNVTGDIGTNVGLAVGFNPLNVNGMIHPIPDVSTTACAADLLTVYNYLNTLPNDIELLYPAQFGNNLVLTPHTYVLNGATTFTDTLYLNAEGNTNAVFVIKVNGALSTSTFARVVLTNGTKAMNVFWKVEGAVNLNNYANFKGTVVCNNGAISLNTGVALEGRALTTGGALSTASVNVAVPSGTCATLPVNWLYFRGNAIQSKTLLEWATSSEVNNGFFTIERSGNGRDFATLTTVTSLTENDKGDLRYSFTDNRPFPLSYYRISQTDKDGQRTYYRTINVKINSGKLVHATHFVQENYINVQTSGLETASGALVLYSQDGKKVFSQKIMLGKEVNNYKIPKPTQKGLYLLYIESQGGKIYDGKVMVL